MIRFWQAVSLLVIAAWAAPVAGLALTRDSAYVLIGVGVVMLELLSRAFHSIPVASLRGLLARPAGARDCSGLNGGGANGMPSGHVAIVTFAGRMSDRLRAEATWPSSLALISLIRNFSSAVFPCV